MDDYRLHLQAGEPGDEGAWFWRLDDAAGLQIAASWAASLADALDAVKRVSTDLGLDDA
ncbi:hypothetical protein HWD35_01240 [Tsukamurella tyrosinosolvens]|jgi:hypothetical protein|uniref:hypothetical protein n=1 Tax=Tsukamurella tyrosinosolvens TaxID=57704 RepID=UPI000AD8C6E1|nr:hypothetical protein [Tsukamurella tyrosinosolvens]MCA4993323.1 hypothetical protein [Tsukamurella tyrosinosolvens]QRY83329.1 hypothetical protein JVY00_15805 [Tsukamurella tyrosinosolvens]WEL95125.1 hypothetical protein P1N98_09735 [Tsukamurella tyrosinosolvens]